MNLNEVGTESWMDKLIYRLFVYETRHECLIFNDRQLHVTTKSMNVKHPHHLTESSQQQLQLEIVVLHIWIQHMLNWSASVGQSVDPHTYWVNSFLTWKYNTFAGYNPSPPKSNCQYQSTRWRLSQGHVVRPRPKRSKWATWCLVRNKTV